MLLVYIFSCFAICQASIADKLDPVQTQCFNEHNLQPEVIGPISDKFNTSEDHEDAGTFFLCLWKGHGVIDEEGAIHGEKLGAFLRLQEANPLSHDQRNDCTVDDIVKSCEAVQAKTAKRTAVKLKNCIMKIVHEL